MKRTNEEVVNALVRGVKNKDFLTHAITILADARLESDRLRPENYLSALVVGFGQLTEQKSLPTLGRDVATIVEVASAYDVCISARSRTPHVLIKESYLLSEFADWYQHMLEGGNQHASTFGMGVFIGALNCLAHDGEHEKGDGRQLWLETRAKGLLKFTEMLLFSDTSFGEFPPAVSGLLSNTVSGAVKNEDCLRVFVRQFLHLFWTKMSPLVNPRTVPPATLQVVNEFLVKGWNQADPFQKAFALETVLQRDPVFQSEV